jgi:alcohol dehydrogenase class IV
LIFGLPKVVTANTVLDALSHCAEGVISKQANPFSDALALEGVRLVAENLRQAYHQGDNLEARWNMAMAAALGGIVISFPWVAGPATLGHAASEGISPKYNMPHGAACGVLLPYVYFFNFQSAYARKKLALIAEAMGVDTCKMSTDKAARAAIESTFDLLEDLDTPTDLKSYGMKETDIQVLAEYILERSETMYSMPAYNPRRATVDNLKEFFVVAYEGREAVRRALDKRYWE